MPGITLLVQVSHTIILRHDSILQAQAKSSTSPYPPQDSFGADHLAISASPYPRPCTNQPSSPQEALHPTLLVPSPPNNTPSSSGHTMPRPLLPASLPRRTFPASQPSPRPISPVPLRRFSRAQTQPIALSDVPVHDAIIGAVESWRANFSSVVVPRAE